MPKIPYTLRHKSGVYKINLKVPKALQNAGAFGGKAKIVESLLTHSYKEAARIAPERVAEIKREFSELEQRLGETGCTAEELASIRPRRRSVAGERWEPLATGSRECCFAGSQQQAEAVAEDFARRMFVRLLRLAESDIEKIYTLGDYGALEEMKAESARVLEMHTSEPSEFQPGVTGREVLVRALRDGGEAFTLEGLEKVKLAHDKFRRVIVEVENRSIARIDELLAARAAGNVAGGGWTERFDGFFRELDAFSEVQSRLQPVATVEEVKGGISLQALCEAYLQKQKDMKVAPKTFRDDVASVKYLLAALKPDFPLARVTIAEAKRVIDFIAKIPKGMKLEGTLEEVRKRAEVGSCATGFTPMSPRTYEKKCKMVKAIFSFAQSDYPEEMKHNPFTASGVVAHMEQATPSGKGREIVPYTVDQLNRLFRLPLYTGHAEGKLGWKKQGSLRSRDTGRYWVPLLMLFHGCRLNEVAQLMTDDVDGAGEIPYFRVSKYHGVTGKVATPKRLKNKSSERLIPIHKELVRCGFLEFVRKRKREGELWIFPEWTHSTVTDWKLGDPVPAETSKHSDLGSDHCLKLTAKILQKGEAQPCNHSMRHMVRTAFRHAEVDSKVAEALMGWSEGKKSMGDHYGETPLSLLSKAVNQIHYEGLDISHLYHVPPRRLRRRHD